MRRVALAALVLLWVGCGSFAVPGRACTKHDECSGLERGYCSKAEICTRECSVSQPCPDNASCSDQGARTVCLPKCEDDTGCFKGFTCRDGVCQVKGALDPFVN